jgi:hypothetical protein
LRKPPHSEKDAGILAASAETAKQQFLDDDEANRLVDVARREPWVI